MSLREYAYNLNLYQEDNNHKKESISVNDNSFERFRSEQLIRLAEFQRFLELSSLTNYFFNLLQVTFKTSYLHLSCSKLKYHYELGNKSHFKKSYVLKLNHHVVGNIELHHSYLLTQKQLNLLRNELKCFIFPLRNSFLYEATRKTALIDPLTGTANRTAFTHLFSEIEQNHHILTKLTVLMIDIDHFKKINDNFGHMAGDHILKCVSQLITKNVRKTDHVYRIGGEEFFVTLENTNANEAYFFAERIRKSIEKLTCYFNKACIKITVSIGMASHINQDNFISLFQKADHALYQAKSQGGNHTVLE